MTECPRCPAGPRYGASGSMSDVLVALDRDQEPLHRLRMRLGHLRSECFRSLLDLDVTRSA